MRGEGDINRGAEGAKRDVTEKEEGAGRARLIEGKI